MTPERPLAGTRVVVTRAAHQAGGLERRLREAGARVALLPLLEIVPPADPAPLQRALARLRTFDWLVLTSTNAVDAVMERVETIPRTVQVAAIGTATAATLAHRGIAPAVVARRAQAEGLVEELAGEIAAGARVLLPQAADARPVLGAGLEKAGARVERVIAYEKRLPPRSPRRFAALFAGDEPWGWVTFTSPSTVSGFVALAGDRWPTERATLLPASIGPVTSAALVRAGAPPRAEAQEPSEAALVGAIVGAAVR